MAKATYYQYSTHNLAALNTVPLLIKIISVHMLNTDSVRKGLHLMEYQ